MPTSTKGSSRTRKKSKAVRDVNANVHRIFDEMIERSEKPIEIISFVSASIARLSIVSGDPDPEFNQHELHRAVEPDHADVHAQVHEAHQRLLEEVRKMLPTVNGLSATSQ